MNRLDQGKTTVIQKKSAFRAITVEEHFATKAIGFVHGPGLDISRDAPQAFFSAHVFYGMLSSYE